MQHVGTRRLQSIVAAIAIHARKVGELLSVAAKIHLIVGLVERAESGEEFALVVALEAGARDHIEEAIGAVAIGSRVAAALRFQIVDVFGIDLRPDVAGDVRVGDGNTIDRPGDLVSAAHVELIVRHPGARYVVGDEVEAVAQVRAGRRLDFAAAHDGNRRHRLGVCGERLFLDGDGLLERVRLPIENAAPERCRKRQRPAVARASNPSRLTVTS